MTKDMTQWGSQEIAQYTRSRLPGHNEHISFPTSTHGTGKTGGGCSSSLPPVDYARDGMRSRLNAEEHDQGRTSARMWGAMILGGVLFWLIVGLFALPLLGKIIANAAYTAQAF